MNWKHKIGLTWLDDPHVEYLLDVSAVSGYLEHSAGLILHTGDVDWHDIIRHATPTYVAVLLLHFEYFRP